LPTRSPMARVRRVADTFTIPEGRRRRVYQPRPRFEYGRGCCQPEELAEPIGMGGRSEPAVELRGRGALGKIRTPDPPGRSRPLLSAELRGRMEARGGIKSPYPVLQTGPSSLWHRAICSLRALLRRRGATKRHRIPAPEPAEPHGIQSGLVAPCWLTGQRPAAGLDVGGRKDVIAKRIPPRVLERRSGAIRCAIAPYEIGAHGEIRTPIFTSGYGSPVRSRRRVRARIDECGGSRPRPGCREANGRVG
jgi:hypothetical protein